MDKKIENLGLRESSMSVGLNSQWKHQFVDANFFLLILDKIAPTKQLTPLVKAKKTSHAHDEFVWGGGALAEEPRDAKVRILREECLESFVEFCKRFGSSFFERMESYL